MYPHTGTQEDPVRARADGFTSPPRHRGHALRQHGNPAGTSQLQIMVVFSSSRDFVCQERRQPQLLGSCRPRDGFQVFVFFKL